MTLRLDAHTVDLLGCARLVLKSPARRSSSQPSDRICLEKTGCPKPIRLASAIT